MTNRYDTSCLRRTGRDIETLLADADEQEYVHASGPSSTFVSCSHCGEDHETSAVEHENIWSDAEDRDVLEYVCPEDGTITHAIVCARR